MQIVGSITPFEKHIVVSEAEQSAISLLSGFCPELSKQKLKLAMKYGAVWLTHGDKTTRLRRAKKALETGDEIHLYYDEHILFSDINAAGLVADEGEYSVWNKPSGMFSQGTKWGDHTSIARWVELFGLSANNRPLRPCFLVHRLDKATNGLILVAHSKTMASKLSSLFENRKVVKKYRAQISGKLPENFIGKTIQMPIDDKPATTIIHSVSYSETRDQSRLLIEIKTGRKHQIRKHLSMIGFPIVGDRLYSSKATQSNEQADLGLQSCFLEFQCPKYQQLMQFELPASTV